MVRLAINHQLSTVPAPYRPVASVRSRRLRARSGRRSAAAYRQVQLCCPVVPLQDLLNLGTDARMNLPGTTGDHNWTWRYRAADLRPDVATTLRELTEATGR